MNEENYVARCIRSVKTAAKYYGGNVESVIVCNRCTDRTADIAQKYGAKVILNEDRCIAKVRNAGITAASGDVIVTEVRLSALKDILFRCTATIILQLQWLVRKNE